jgi:hypothetical protein
MKENYHSWWEREGLVTFLKELIKRPRVVARQFQVAHDMAQAPISSDQETFPTLLPKEAESSFVLSNLIASAKSGNPEALTELSSIAFGGNVFAREAIHQIERKGVKFDSVSVGHEGQEKNKSIVWPKSVESGERGPKLGDIPLHNNY